MSLLLALAVASIPPLTPIQFGRRELIEALGPENVRVRLLPQASLGKEAYRIVGDGQTVKVYGGDANGVMYGAMEFAERFRNSPSPRMNRVAGRGLGGGEVWSTRASGKPYLADRGLNLFLTLPWDYKKNDTDYSLEALTDPDRWWFHNEDYWTTLLDLMARSRLNWLDIHGAWDISVTNAPNLYAYFVTSKTFPKVGVSEEIKAKNLNQLNHVIEMAHARGIRVSLMAYEANLRIPQNPNPGYEASEANIYTYTKEVVEQMIRRAPKLDALGYRIGESGKGEAFFHCYGEAVKASGRDIPLITRSWITRRQNVLPLARASKDYTVQIKYNGEQWGAPYMVAGGRMANWYSYSFEDYLSDSSAVPDLGVRRDIGALQAPPKAAKMWPGNLVSELGRDAQATPQRWPSNPYKIVWQVRANGTHRIFPFYNPEMVRSTIKTMKIGTATGYTIEGLDAYYPKSPHYYLANPGDKYCDWIHQRDEMYWMTWGRLGYDPGVKDEVFESHMRKWFGAKASEVAADWSAASGIVPACFAAFALGPDHRNEAPELELFGDTEGFIQGEPLDSFTRSSVREFALMRTLGLTDGREPPPNLAYAMDLAALLSPPEEPLSNNPRLRELQIARRMASFLGTYYAARTRSATGIAELERVTGKRLAGTYSRNNIDAALEAWGKLAESTEGRYYRPFTERLRMRTNTFHWSSLLANMRQIRDQVHALPWNTTTTNWQSRFQSASPEAQLSWNRRNGKIELTLRGEGIRKAKLLYKPLPSSTFFHSSPMRVVGGSFRAALPDAKFGLCVAAEITGTSGSASRTSGTGDRQGDQPYQIIPALPGPTPQIYSTEEAMTYLDPAVLKPEKYAAMLVAPRGMRFHNGFDKATKRKILDPVERGMTLVVMQQDYVSGRYKMDWLPVPLKVENNPQPTVFDPGGAMGLKRIETSDILWQRFVSDSPRGGERESGGGALSVGPSSAPHPGAQTSPTLSPAGGEGEWEVLGNGGVAHLKWGKGHIWMINARLMQRMTHPDCARALKRLMEFCASPLTPQPPLPAIHRGEGGKRPVVVIDPGTEDAAYSTSFFPDFMNALDIPFLTLGEVIAKEQGIDSFIPIPGKVEDDDILQGNGERMVNAFLRNQVIQASKRPTPSNLADFEKERTRRKAELYRCLGLDPMPPKTPLNARITGVIQRNGYRIEKVVFESRPKFYVTAHVYVPDSPSPRVGERGLGGEGPSFRIGPFSQTEIRPPVTQAHDHRRPSPHPRERVMDSALRPMIESESTPHPGARTIADPPPVIHRGEGVGYPIIVHVNGHWAHKKGEDRLQLRAAFCALQGYIAVVVDSPGWSFEGNSLIERRAEGNHNDWFLFHGGTNATGYYVWDCIRALDYMETRADADISRIGITGASGGGLATLYTFAADDRYKAAVPVVYMASMELAPDNGCLCNHVPGTSQIGDRSDVIAIQAPKPVLIMGAHNDPEFPPAATLLTVEKMKKTWALFESPPLPSQGRGGWGMRGGPLLEDGSVKGASQPPPRAPEIPTLPLGKREGEVQGRIFEGPHDYNQAMREQMIGFFNRHLKGEGDGSPVPQPPIEIIDPEDRQLLVLDPPPSDERSMRDLSLEYLRNPLSGDPVALSGGTPKSGDLRWRETTISATKRHVTFESEPGLVTPAILILPASGKANGYVIHVSEAGKATLLGRGTQGTKAHLYVDLLGTGELDKLELRYLMYLGQSVAFKGGWQLVVASRAMRKYGGGGSVEAWGPLASQAVYWAQLLDREAFGMSARGGWMSAWEDVLKPGMSPLLIQPRAHLFGRLQ